SDPGDQSPGVPTTAVSVRDRGPAQTGRSRRCRSFAPEEAALRGLGLEPSAPRGVDRPDRGELPPTCLSTDSERFGLGRRRLVALLPSLSGLGDVVASLGEVEPVPVSLPKNQELLRWE